MNIFYAQFFALCVSNVGFVFDVSILMTAKTTLSNNGKLFLALYSSNSFPICDRCVQEQWISQPKKLSFLTGNDYVRCYMAEIRG